MLSVYPYPIITWEVDDTPISENNKEEIGSLGPFYINSRVNITGSNSSYQCAIENTLLKQTWTGRWTMKGRLHKAFCVPVLSEIGREWGLIYRLREEHKGRKCICSS